MTSPLLSEATLDEIEEEFRRRFKRWLLVVDDSADHPHATQYRCSEIVEGMGLATWTIGRMHNQWGDAVEDDDA